MGDLGSATAAAGEDWQTSALVDARSDGRYLLRPAFRLPVAHGTRLLRPAIDGLPMVRTVARRRCVRDDQPPSLGARPRTNGAAGKPLGRWVRPPAFQTHRGR